MKRYILFLLLSIFLMSASTNALAADVKFSGQFYAAGMYLDQTSLTKDAAGHPSTAFYFQRLRVQTEFIVSPALKLITRFDILERIWGGARSNPASTTSDMGSAGTRAENENIAFDWVYLSYASKIGLWRVGYMNDGAWGTVFMDSSTPRGKVAWAYRAPNWMFTIQTAKMAENNFSAVNPTATASDVDANKYCMAFRYKWKSAEAGILIGLGRSASNKPTQHYKSLYNNFMPYTKIHHGPLKVQAELIYFVGKLKNYEDSSFGDDVRLSALSAWLDVTADFGMAYVGGTFAYVAGDDPSTTKKEGDAMRNNGGRDWDPCLILWNNNLTYWVGSLAGNGTSVNAGPMYNAFFYQVRGGLRPINNLDIMASVSYAEADKKPWATAGDPSSVYLKKDYGIELDVVATYKITDNLAYMLGFGYLWTGDYFKETNSNASVSDNYLFLNKLTFTF
ncbi:MAG TPA: hypothetical protein ENN23_09095 [Deltaproteobacteria bacterium]|nr:hypothetical protein [Deltaproteobacteria bacterium]